MIKNKTVKASGKRRTGKASYYERFMAMTDAERDREVAQFDRSGVPGKPLTSAQRAQHRRARNKGGRPVVGKGARRVLVSIEGGLLDESDRFAKQIGVNRSQLIARGLKLAIRQCSVAPNRRSHSV